MATKTLQIKENKLDTLDPTKSIIESIQPSSFTDVSLKNDIMDSLKTYKKEVINYTKNNNTIVVDSDETFDFLKREIKFCSEKEKQVEEAINSINSADPDIATVLNTLLDIKETYRSSRLNMTNTTKQAKQNLISETANKVQTICSEYIEEILQNTIEELSNTISNASDDNFDYLRIAVKVWYNSECNLGTLTEVPKGIRKLDRITVVYNEYLGSFQEKADNLIEELRSKCLVTADLTTQKTICIIPNISKALLTCTPDQYKSHIEEYLLKLEETVKEQPKQTKPKNKPIFQKVPDAPVVEPNIEEEEEDLVPETSTNPAITYKLKVEITTQDFIEDVVAALKQDYPCITKVTRDE